MKRYLTACLAELLFAASSLSIAAATVDPLVSEVTKANDIVQLATYDVRMRFIDVWVKQDGHWKWASSQVAHFPDPPHQ